MYWTATWTAFVTNAVVWELFYFARHRIGVHESFVAYQLNVWPLLLAIIILMTGEARARGQVRIEADQQALLDAMSAQTTAIRLLIEQNIARDDVGSIRRDEVEMTQLLREMRKEMATLRKIVERTQDGDQDATDVNGDPSI